MEKDAIILYKKLLLKLIPYKNDIDLSLMDKAFTLAKKCHGDQKRKSGELYIIHPLMTALILVKSGAGRDTNLVVAALLHDVVEDGKITIEEIEKEFGSDVANLVAGVTKKPINECKNHRATYYIENRKKIICELQNDVRIIILKLADRLHNMRTLNFLSPEKQKVIAKETLDIFVPLAHILGMGLVEKELKELAFKYYKPDSYKEMRKKRTEYINNNMVAYQDFLESISVFLKKNNLIQGEKAKIRFANLTSISKKHSSYVPICDMEEFASVIIVTDSVEDCYLAMERIRDGYRCVPNTYKDYIAEPRKNGHQSLNVVVKTSEGFLITIKVRTFEMEDIANKGLIAHKYIGKGFTTQEINYILWAQNEFVRKLGKVDPKIGPEEYVNASKKVGLKKEIVVYTKSGERVLIPEGSSAIDFAYRIHTDIGNKFYYAVINGRRVPLDYVLMKKDKIDVITSDNTLGPEEWWLKYVTTRRARSAIKNYLKKKNIKGLVKR